MAHYIFCSLALYKTFSNRSVKEVNRFLLLIPLVAHTYKANIKFFFLSCISVYTNKKERELKVWFILRHFNLEVKKKMMKNDEKC